MLLWLSFSSDEEFINLLCFSHITILIVYVDCEYSSKLIFTIQNNKNIQATLSPKPPISIDFIEDSALVGLLEDVDPGHIFHLNVVVDPRCHQIPHNHPILEVDLQDGSEFLLFEEILVVLEVDAWFALDSSDDLEGIKLVLCKMFFQVVEEGGPEARQEVLGGIGFLFCLILLPLFLLLLQDVFPFLVFKGILGGGTRVFLRFCDLDLYLFHRCLFFFFYSRFSPIKLC